MQLLVGLSQILDLVEVDLLLVMALLIELVELVN